MTSHEIAQAAADAPLLARQAERIQALEAENARLRKERDKALVALGEMVGQYCNWNDEQFGACYFHMFMGAPEDAFELLENHGLLKELGHEKYAFTDKYRNL